MKYFYTFLLFIFTFVNANAEQLADRCSFFEKKFNDEFNKLHWYDQKVFEIIASGTKIAELSRKSQITYISLYNTYTKVKKLLKKKVGL